MKIVKIKPELLQKFSIDPQMLRKENHPCVLILRLNYKDSVYNFAVPVRSNIPAASPKNEYFPLPTRYTTKDRNRHGLHYIKMFPVDKPYYDKYRTENNIAASLMKASIEDNHGRIVKECQNYLDRYSAGNRPIFATDLDLLLCLLYPELPSQKDNSALLS